MDQTQLDHSKRAFRILLLPVTLLLGLGWYGFIPWSFDTMLPSSKTPFTFESNTVVKYGVSHISQKSIGCGPGNSCVTFQGRAFVDYLKDGRVWRQYGWRLSIKTTFNPQTRRNFKTEIALSQNILD